MAYHDDHECDVTGAHVHPEDFGAIPDGKTDCSNALQEAVNAAMAMDGGIQLVAGATYRCTQPLRIADDVSIGGGPNCTMSVS